MLFQFREYGDQVLKGSRDPKLIELLASRDAAGLRRFVPAAGLGTGEGAAVDSWSVQDAAGGAAARRPPPPDPSYWARNFGFRSYFKGGSALGPAREGASVHVSGAFKSEADERLKFGVGRPSFRSASRAPRPPTMRFAARETTRG